MTDNFNVSATLNTLDITETNHRGVLKITKDPSRMSYSLRNNILYYLLGYY